MSDANSCFILLLAVPLLVILSHRGVRDLLSVSYDAMSPSLELTKRTDICSDFVRHSDLEPEPYGPEQI